MFLQQTFVYPPKAVRKNIEGEVMLQLVIDEKGHIADARAISGDPLLQKAALDVMKQSPDYWCTRIFPNMMNTSGNR